MMDVRNLLNKYQVRPSKGLGQNFLVDKKVLKKIIESAEISPNDIVLEVGPGIGNLTWELAKRAKKVVCVEKDPKMIEILKDALAEFKTIKIIQGDILKIPNSKLQIPKNYKVVANLPYYVALPVIRKFLEAENPPRAMVLTVQKEVGQRICSRPPKMNLLAVSVQFYGEPKLIAYISKRAFFPRPKIDSAILKITPKENQKSGPCQFFSLVRAGFSQPRKQILNNFARVLKLNKEKAKTWLLKNNIQPNQRAETLTLEKWLSLAKTFKWKKEE